MKKITILSAFLIFIIYNTCRAQTSTVNKENRAASKDIDGVYDSLSNGKKIILKEIKERFDYSNPKENSNKNVAFLNSKILKKTISYISYADSTKDILKTGDDRVVLNEKIDPLSTQVFRFDFNSKKYITFLGKGQSASGTGLQNTFFIIEELSSNWRVIDHYEFHTRFGDIASLTDYNNDGRLDYFKIANGEKYNDFKLTVNDVRTNKQIVDGYILLRYHLNDEFQVLKSVNFGK